MKTLKGKHAVVTGGAGFAGSHLVDRLIDEQVSRISVLSNFSLGKRDNLKDAEARFPIDVVQMDVSDGLAVLNFLSKAKADVIFHLASIPLMRSMERPELVFREILEMETNLLRAQKDGYFKTLVQFSTSEVYGTNRTDEPMPESHPTNPTTPYAIAKLMADHIAMFNHRTYGSDIVIVRPFNFYGPRQNWGEMAAIIPLIFRKIARHEEIFIDGDGRQTRDFTFVDDVVRATIDLYKEPACRGIPVNIGSGKAVSIEALVNMICHITGSFTGVTYRPDRVCQVKNLCSDTSLAKAMIGFDPKISLEEGLKLSADWYREALDA